MLKCPICGSMNDDKAKRCNQCGAWLLDEYWKPKKVEPLKGIFKNWGLWVTILGVIGIVALVCYPSSTNIPQTSPKTNTPAANINPIQNTKVLELPLNGETKYYKHGEAIAPFSVITQPNTNTNYLLKLVDKNTSQVVLTIFVRGGQSIHTKVPLGTYELRYACGTNWYGEKELFGPGTVCQKADTIFDFYRNGPTIMGHTVSLVKQVNGNLPTSRISNASF